MKYFAIGFKQKYFFVSLLFSILRGANSESDDREMPNLMTLQTDILKNYDKSSRPVVHHTNTTNLAMTLKPFYISELNEVKSVLIMDSWTIFVWNDDHLTWNPAQYQGLKSIPFGSSMIWKPDITVYNSCPASDIDPFGKTNMIVSSDGMVKWVPPATTRSICFLDYTDYPWDRQICSILFGSWSQHGFEINLTLPEDTVNLSDFKDTNPYWKLQNITVERNVMYYGPTPYIVLEYNVTISRRPTIGQQLEWISSIGIVILTLAAFWLPPNSDAKLTLGSINILTSTGLLLYLEAHLKSVANLPYIARLMNFSLYTVASAMIFEVLVMNMALTFGPCSPPEILYNAISGIAGRILLVNVMEPPAEDTTVKPPVRKQWLTIATMTDRILFCIFLIALLAIPKTG